MTLNEIAKIRLRMIIRRRPPRQHGDAASLFRETALGGAVIWRSPKLRRIAVARGRGTRFPNTALAASHADPESKRREEKPADLAEKAGIKRGSIICGGQETGWGGRIRTSASRDQNPLPYRLATPHPAANRISPASQHSPDRLYRRIGRLEIFTDSAADPEAASARPGQRRPGPYALSSPGRRFRPRFIAASRARRNAIKR